jgi:Tfp pilus assembly protein FimT
VSKAVDEKNRGLPRSEVGLSLMEAIVGILAALILGSVLLHVIRLGYAMYKLNSATNEVADQLNKAREIAMRDGRKVSVIFDAEENKFGIDLNNNNKLDRGEAEEMPEGVTFSESAVFSFTPAGTPPQKTKLPSITISNARNSRSISVSSLGSIEIDEIE